MLLEAVAAARRRAILLLLDALETTKLMTLLLDTPVMQAAMLLLRVELYREASELYELRLMPAMVCVVIMAQ